MCVIGISTCLTHINHFKSKSKWIKLLKSFHLFRCVARLGKIIMKISGRGPKVKQIYVDYGHNKFVSKRDLKLNTGATGRRRDFDEVKSKAEMDDRRGRGMAKHCAIETKHIIHRINRKLRGEKWPKTITNKNNKPKSAKKKGKKEKKNKTVRAGGNSEIRLNKHLPHWPIRYSHPNAGDFSN